MNYMNKHILLLEQDMYNAKDSISVTEENQHNSQDNSHNSPIYRCRIWENLLEMDFIFIISCFFFLLVHKRGEAGPLNRIWRGPLTFLMPP